MTNEERDLISQFVARVGGNASGGFGRVVSTQPALPPIDPEADRFIADQFASHPEARYRITQMAVVQEAALAEAASRIQQLQQALQSAQQQQQQQAQPAPSRGFLGGLFGGGQGAAPQQQQGSPWNQGQQQQYAPPPPQYPPNMSPGMFQRSGGSGFLGSALTTAAGVAGGMVAGNALMDLFSGHGGGGFGGGGFGGGGFGGGMAPETTIINNYGDNSGASGGLMDNSTQGDAGWDNSGGGGFDSGGGGFDGGGGGFDTGGGGGFDDSSL